MLTSLLENELIEMTQPDSPRSPTQKYRLTELARQILLGIGCIASADSQKMSKSHPTSHIGPSLLSYGYQLVLRAKPLSNTQQRRSSRAFAHKLK